MEAQNQNNDIALDLQELCEDLDADTEDIAIEFFTGEFDYEGIAAPNIPASGSIVDRIRAWFSF